SASTASRRSPCRSCSISARKRSSARRRRTCSGKRRTIWSERRWGMAEALRAAAGAEAKPALVAVAGVVLEAFPEGALWWADPGLLAVADLHLEKGSSFARRGQMLPPYDTGETLARLAMLVARLNPRLVVALGDSFHDDDGPARLSARDRDSL